ncbi:MAG: trehalose-phosphatase, partial [Candidatus Omnitrophica bacterium]|nr:trehalose-phosphatase [Candidatus Omnitrophota bacterium]
MKYIFNALDAIKKEMSGKELYLFLDYDGTLTPIVDHPQHAALPAPTKKLLKEFIKQPHCKVSIVTGRALSDIRRVIGMQHITYIGNHGFEIDDPKVSFKGFDLTHTREILEYLKWQINKELVFFKGAFIEDKGICLCIHYRQLQEGQT